MVNNRIVSRFTGALPEHGNDRKIRGGPLYPAEEVMSLLGNGGSESIITWTKKCTSDVQRWSLNDDDLFDLLGIAVYSGRFIGAEWCEQKPGGPWAACDAYSVIRKEWIPATRKEMDFEYYIKFAIGKTGKILLLVSCHPPEEWR